MTYWQELTEAVGGGWNRFWYSPRDPRITSLLRILVGACALYFVLSHTADLTRWFGPNGLLPRDTVATLTTDPANAGRMIGRWSYLDYAATESDLRTMHWVGIAIVALFMAGAFSRATSVLSAVVVLSYVHRAPMITGQFEPVLTFLLLYLCLAPTGAEWSLDAWWRRRSRPDYRPEPSVMANVAVRLIQVHLSMLYLLIGFTMLGGTMFAEYDPTWWRGQALWWLITRSESRLVDLTFLHGTTPTYFLNLWTHLVVALNLACGALLWNRLARPLLLVLVAVNWIALGLVTGLLSYAAIMIVAGLAFVAPERLAAWSTPKSAAA